MKFIVILMAVARFSPIAVIIILNMYIIDIRTITMIRLEARKWQMKGILRSEKVCQTAHPQGHEHQTTRRSFNAKAKKCGLIKDKKAPISFKTRAEALHMCVEHSGAHSTPAWFKDACPW